MPAKPPTEYHLPAGVIHKDRTVVIRCPKCSAAARVFWRTLSTLGPFLCPCTKRPTAMVPEAAKTPWTPTATPAKAES